MESKYLLKNSSPQANLRFKIYITSIYQETLGHRIKVVTTWLYLIGPGGNQHRFLKDRMHSQLRPHKISRLIPDNTSSLTKIAKQRNSRSLAVTSRSNRKNFRYWNYELQIVIQLCSVFLKE